MELKTIRYEVADHVARLTLDRPHRGNAWTGRMHLEYRWAMTEAERDGDVRVVVVTGAERTTDAPPSAWAPTPRPSRATSTRAATTTACGGAEPPMPDVADPFAADFAFQLGMRTPVVAAVNGAAAGVGLVIACFADIRFAVRGAKLTTAAPKLGFPAEYGLSWLLPRLVGAGRAADWLLSGRVFLTDEAGDAGLFSAVLPADELDRSRRAIRDRPRPPRLAGLGGRHQGAALGRPAPRRSRPRRSPNRCALLREMSTGPDFVEGARALSERRRPEF